MVDIHSSIVRELEWQAHVPQRRYLHEHGEVFTGVRRPKDVHRRAAKQSFMNVAAFVDEHRAYQYCEGLALAKVDRPFPCEHAWVALRGSSEAIELTWAEPGIAYFGIRVAQADLIRSQIETGIYA